MNLDRISAIVSSNRFNKVNDENKLKFKSSYQNLFKNIIKSVDERFDEKDENNYKDIRAQKVFNIIHHNFINYINYLNNKR